MEVRYFKETNNADSIFIYIPNYLNQKFQKKLLECLNKIKYNYNTDEKIYRLQKWYQEDNKYFCNKWKKRFVKWESNKIPDEIKELQENLQIKIINIINNIKYNIKIPKFNSCLLNFYRNGNDSISDHQDTHLSFGREPVIAAISLGVCRNIEFKRVDKKNLNFLQKLSTGSLFIMMGSSQRYWTHGIPKSETNKCRHSLTFREYII